MHGVSIVLSISKPPSLTIRDASVVVITATRGVVERDCGVPVVVDAVAVVSHAIYIGNYKLRIDQVDW